MSHTKASSPSPVLKGWRPCFRSNHRTWWWWPASRWRCPAPYLVTMVLSCGSKMAWLLGWAETCLVSNGDNDTLCFCITLIFLKNDILFSSNAASQKKNHFYKVASRNQSLWNAFKRQEQSDYCTHDIQSINSSKMGPSHSHIHISISIKSVSNKKEMLRTARQITSTGFKIFVSL